MPKERNRIATLVRQQLTTVRESAGLTQEDLAREIGLDQPQMSKLESGRTELAVVDLVLAARALGVTPARLLATVPTPPRQMTLPIDKLARSDARLVQQLVHTLVQCAKARRPASRSIRKSAAR
jgi:transcriptional regulator with XRE-family HTH domain